MNEEGFQQLVIAHQDKVYNLCLGFMKNQEEAQDMAQEVFLHIYQNIGKFKGDSLLSTWIYRVTANKCLEEIRKRGRKKRAANLEDINAPHIQNKATDHFHPGVALENQQRAAILFQAIEQLPDQQQTAFTLAKVEHLSYEEIASVMEKSVSSVESLIHRAKQNLRKILREYYERI